MPSDFDSLTFVAAFPVPHLLLHLEHNLRSNLAEALAQHGGPDPSLEKELLSRNLVLSDGSISNRGRTCSCCIEGIEGCDIVDLVDRLRGLDPAASRVSLVREGMTTQFVDMLGRLDPIKRLMICSPWISLDRMRLRRLIRAVETSERRRGHRPEITVLTRPLEDQPKGELNETLDYLRRIGSVVAYQPRLHSKLYIIEAGEERTQRFAFVGSENFTKVRYQELGILVSNDHQLIDDLVRYFLATASP